MSLFECQVLLACPQGNRLSKTAKSNFSLSVIASMHTQYTHAKYEYADTQTWGVVTFIDPQNTNSGKSYSKLAVYIKHENYQDLSVC